MTDEMRRLIASLRRGDAVPVRDLSELATKLVDVLAILEAIHSRGAHVEDAAGRRSDKDAVTMLREALPKLRKGTTRRVAKKSGSKGGRKPNDKMDPELAELIWHDSRYNIEQKLKKMHGWYYKLAYDKFGPTGGKRTGRPPQKPKSKRR